MLEIYEQLTQEEQEKLQDVISSCTVRPSCWKENMIKKQAG